MRSAKIIASRSVLAFSGFTFCAVSAWAQCDTGPDTPGLKNKSQTSGMSQLSIGQNKNATARSNEYLALSTRGTVSTGRWMQEYDLAYLSTNATIADHSPSENRSAASYRLAAFSMALNSGARVYAGNFPAAAGDIGQSVGNFFFTHPAIVGMAYKSSGTALSDYGMRGAIRLVLPMQSQVRISSAGRELFNGVLGAGDQTVEFSGYQDSFVDVFVRDASGITRTQVAEVIRSLGAPGGPVAGSGFWGDLYLDAGRLVETKDAGAGVRLSDTGQLAASYVQSAWDYLVLAGYQSVGERRRFAVSVAPTGRTWQMNFMRGNQMESGYNFSGPLLRWGKIELLLNQTSYRTPLTTVYTNGRPLYYQNDKLCLANRTPVCHQAMSFDSVGLTLGHEGFPVHLGYIETHTLIERLSAATVSGVYKFSIMGFPLSATGFIARDLQKKNHSVFVSLTIPLGEYASFSNGFSSNGEKYHTTSASYTSHAEETSEDINRALNLTAAATHSPDGPYSSASAYMDNRSGLLENISNFAVTDRGAHSIDSTFSMAHEGSAGAVACNQNQLSTSP
jgi:hypothetical protein